MSTSPPPPSAAGSATTSATASSTVSAVKIVSVPEVRVLSLRRVISNYGAQGDLWYQLLAFAKAHNIAAIDARFQVLHRALSAEPGSNAGIDVEICIPIDASAASVTIDKDDDSTNGISVRVVPSLTRAAMVTLTGPCTELPSAYTALHTWLDKQHTTAAGPTREVYRYDDYANDPSGTRCVSDVYVPL